MEEKVFFKHEDVQVTNARFVSGSQTYAMSNVTSVKAVESAPKRFWMVILLLLGLMVATVNIWAGSAAALVAGLVLWQQKTTYHVMLATAGGEVSALKTHQREYLDQIVGALNQAIISRG